ncbi:hypothetical protein JCM11641_001381 [Rhodosporidiobolus odoratus]
MRDEIRVTDLYLTTPALSRDHWQRANREQPLILSLEIKTDVSTEATTDSLLAQSLNYGTVAKVIEGHVASLAADDFDQEGIALEVLAEQLARVILFKASAPNVLLELRRPRAHLRADSVGVRIRRSRSDYLVPSSPPPSASVNDLQLHPQSRARQDDTLFVSHLRRHIVIGLNACEREDEQEVVVDLDFGAPPTDKMSTATVLQGGRGGWKGWKGMVKKVEEHLTASAPLTIEHICTSVAQLILTPPSASSPASPNWDVPRTTVRISKPAALMFAKHPGVAVTRIRADFFPSTLPSFRSFSSLTSAEKHIAYLGIGTNLGERAGNLGSALKALEKLAKGEVRVLDTSFLYESEAMYHEEQGNFLNAAVKIETTLSPPSLLAVLKSVESSLGRDFSTFRNGPRVIDLDLLLYDDVALDSREEKGAQADDERWLRVPHLALQEREFVLRPLVDIAPDLLHPILQQTPSQLLSSVLSASRSTVHRVYPLSRSFVEPYSRLSAPIPSRTLLMSILNATPDSFSDGGLNAALPSAVSSALSHLAQGTSILDIGGMSTRPHATDVSPEEEAQRVVPLIRSLREEHGVIVPISVDTFRPSVARAAIEAGATVINDVYGGREPDMLETMAELDVPVVLMHSRGTPETMTTLADYAKDGGVVQGVRREMQEMVRSALEAGIRRWNVILDPGIGFAKTADQNYELLSALPRLFGESEMLKEFPVLVGLSRKRFLGPEKDAKDRVLETAAGVVASVASGVCEVVRVHDVRAMAEAVKVADAIYRR